MYSVSCLFVKKATGKKNVSDQAIKASRRILRSFCDVLHAKVALRAISFYADSVQDDRPYSPSAFVFFHEVSSAKDNWQSGGGIRGNRAESFP